MKVSTIGIAVVAGIALGGIQGLGTTATFSGSGSIITARAAINDKVVDHSPDNPDSTENPLQGCTWKLTADGVLHLESGKLPEAAEHYNSMQSSFYNIQVREGGDNNDLPLDVISLDGEIRAPEDASYLFGSLLSSGKGKPVIKGLSNLNTQGSTDFSYMFNGYNKSALDVSNFDTSQATNMQEMFSGVKEVTGLNKLKTDNVTDMSLMFYGYGDETKNSSLDLSNWSVNKVTNFYQMFGAAHLKSINLGNWIPQGSLKDIFSGSDTTETTRLTLSPQDILSGSGLLGPDTSYWSDTDEEKAKYTGNWENIKDQYIKGEKPTYDTEGLVAMYSPDSLTTPTDNETYIWEPSITPGNPVTVHYVDQNGKTIQADKQVPGDYDKTYEIAPDKIAGYDYVGVKDGSLTGTYDSDAKEVTLTYKKAAPTTGGTATEPAADSSSEATSETPEADQPQTNPTNPVAKKNRAITAVKKLGLYRTPNFSKRTRIAYYPKQSRTKRPQFVILGVAQSKNGVKRYLVRDVNHGTKRDGQTGYITAKPAFTTHTYYQNNPKAVKVLARVNDYRNKALKHQVKTYQPGKVLRVKKLVHYRLTTRLVLRDGTFITGNKVKLIMQ